MKKITALVYKAFAYIPVKFRFLAYVALAFSCGIAFMNIDSYTADRIGANWLLWVYGIVSGLCVVAITYTALSENKQ